MIRLSKSKLMLGIQCHKRLWWTYHERDAPELVPDAALQAVFERGTRVGEVAREQYGGGTLVEFDPRSKTGPDEAVAMTRTLLDAGETTIYEACFRERGVFVAIDILRKVDGMWVLGEVKSTLSAKPQHIRDAAIQAWVAREAGVDIRRVEIIHLNPEHRHPDVNPLFDATDVTQEAEAFIPLTANLALTQLKMLEGKLPAVRTGEHCYTPYSCPFQERCFDAPPPQHVGELYRIGASLAELRRQGHATIAEIPEDYKLSPVNRRLRASVLAQDIVVESGLLGVLDAIVGPVAYLDFETIMPALPVWKGCAPYQQLTVQFSVHRRTAQGIEHEDFLAEGSADRRRELARALLDATRGYASVLVYFASFESRRILELAHAFPELAEELRDLERRLVDLLPIVREHVGHPEFRGSFSLKRVAPALLSSGYEDLVVADGATAATLLTQLLLNPEGLQRDHAELRAQLLAYCERDTQVLVRLHDELRRLARYSEHELPGS